MALTMTMNFIAVSPSNMDFGAAFPDNFDRPSSGSTITSNEGPGNRQLSPDFLKIVGRRPPTFDIVRIATMMIYGAAVVRSCRKPKLARALHSFRKGVAP